LFGDFLEFVGIRSDKSVNFKDKNKKSNVFIYEQHKIINNAFFIYFYTKRKTF